MLAELTVMSPAVVATLICATSTSLSTIGDAFRVTFAVVMLGLPLLQFAALDHKLLPLPALLFAPPLSKSEAPTSLSSIVIVTCCVPFSTTFEETADISIITVSLLSSITSSTAVTVAVPVVCPAAIAIDVVLNV